MLRRIICWLICIVAPVVIASDHSEADSIAGSHPEVEIYRLTTNHPWETYRDDTMGSVAKNLEELIMAHDHEREFLTPHGSSNFRRRVDVAPYYGITQKDLCKENNGNCSQICETVGHQRVCSCHEGYSFASPTYCSPVSGCDIVVSGTSGSFIVRESPCQWTIKAPNHNIIEITLRIRKNYDSYYSDDYYAYPMPSATIYSYNGEIIKHIRYDMEETILTSSGQNLVIKAHQGWSQQTYTLHVSYVTGSQYLELDNDQSFGLLEYSLSENEECFSLTHSTLQYDSFQAIIKQEINEQTLKGLIREFSFQGPDGKWKRDIFRLPFSQGNKTLRFKFWGDRTRVYNAGRCINLEYYALGGPQSDGLGTVCRNGGVWNTALKSCFCHQGFTGDHCEKVLWTLCRNGGVWKTATQSCICPQGFTGDHCEEGCGPNRYGENCSKLCSYYLSNGCEGVIFCTKDICSCAPGFHGLRCSSLCDAGYYGASCKQRCGKCEGGIPCDPYTGRCHSGCSTGFYPPFCQQTYKVLVTPPKIVGATYNSLKIIIPFENAVGEGEPVLYQVQYRMMDEMSWSKLSPRIISNETEFEIMGLLPGKQYVTRVILIDKDGGSYETDVRTSDARTKCEDQAEYRFAAKYVDDNSVHLGFSHEHDKSSLSCEIVYFELFVLCGDERFKFTIMENEGSMHLTEMMPNTSYSLQLIGKTVTGGSTPPLEIAVRTLPGAPGRVRNVEAVPLASGRQLNVTWQSPWGSEGESLQYRVTYQCERLLACEDASCVSSGDIQVSSTAVLLDDLRPHALYQIQITSLSVGGLTSESYTINAVTPHAASRVAPSAAESPVLAVTNTSALLSWLPPQDCSALSGYIYGYSYALVGNDTQGILQQGTVPENIQSVNISGLTPSHCYNAHITVVSSVVASLSDLLIIPFCTSSTAPDRVQSLSVYKRGRRMVGLRWSLPLNTYGDIGSFTITISTEGTNHSRKLTTVPKHCGAWVDLYCYTITGLSPGKKYHFEVQARNKEVSIDGESSSVEAITSEGASSAPVNLSIINATESSMLLQWGMPDNVNGHLRSFIIVVEQIETAGNSDECCDEIPLQDYQVVSEEPLYQYEITGLSAAGTYSVTVSAKTVTLGEESRIIGHTYPPKPSLPQNALTIVKTGNNGYEPDIVSLQMKPDERISGVNRTYILLYLTNSSRAQQPSDHLQLHTLLQSGVTESYHVISEFTQEEVENQPVVTFHLKDLGLQSTQTKSQKFALILIQEYMGYRSMDIFITEEK